jgi:hypothetical protein
MRKLSFGSAWGAYWQPVLFYGLLIALCGWLLWWQLGTLSGGYSLHELETAQASSSLRAIFEHPLNAPFKLLTHGFMYVTDSNLFAARLAAVLCGIGALTAFYLLARAWHGARTAIIGTLLFGLSAWFLHTARLGVPDVTLFGLLALVTAYVWLRRTGSGWALLLCFILASALLYVPGMAWFIILGVVFQWRRVDRFFKRNLWAVTIGGLLFLAALAPIGLAIYHDPDIAKSFAGLPADGWPLPLDVLRNLAEVPIHLFILGVDNPEHWLGRLATLDFFSITMFVLGGYLYIRHIGLARSRLLLAVLITGSILVALGGSVSLTILIPFLYIVTAAGVTFMLDRWLTVFPRNRIAQTAGYSLIGLAIITVSWYSFRHYFIAWPAAADTKAVFTIHEAPIPSGTIRQ